MIPRKKIRKRSDSLLVVLLHRLALAIITFVCLFVIEHHFVIHPSSKINIVFLSVANPYHMVPVHLKDM